MGVTCLELALVLLRERKHERYGSVSVAAANDEIVVECGEEGAEKIMACSRRP